MTNKQNCLFIGNCQNQGIIHYLSYSKEFMNTYNINSYANWQLIENQSEIPMKDIQEADLFVCQPLRPVHGCYSTDPSVKGSIGSYVKDDCIKFSYPYVFSSAMWPIVQAGQNQNRWFGNEIIDELLLHGFSRNKIIEMHYENKINWKYKERFEKSVEILKEKETITNLKISDFIENNYRDKLLFLIPHHPTSIIFFHLANLILKGLNMNELDESVICGINDVGLPDSTYNQNSNMFPLHISAVQEYELNYGEEYLNFSEDFYAQRIMTYLQLNY